MPRPGIQDTVPCEVHPKGPVCGLALAIGSETRSMPVGERCRRQGLARIIAGPLQQPLPWGCSFWCSRGDAPLSPFQLQPCPSGYVHSLEQERLLRVCPRGRGTGRNGVTRTRDTGLHVHAEVRAMPLAQPGSSLAVGVAWWMGVCHSQVVGGATLGLGN
jgi:hypothetical protein